MTAQIIPFPGAPRAGAAPSDVVYRYVAVAPAERWRCAWRDRGLGTVVGRSHLKDFVTGYEVELDGEDGRRRMALPSQVRAVPDTGPNANLARPA